MRTLKPQLIRNCRLSDSPAQKDMLLMPEGVIKLKGTAVDIVILCDGKRTLEEIFTALKSKYSSANPEQIESEALAFIQTLREKRVLDLK